MSWDIYGQKHFLCVLFCFQPFWRMLSHGNCWCLLQSIWIELTKNYIHRYHIQRQRTLVIKKCMEFQFLIFLILYYNPIPYQICYKNILVKYGITTKRIQVIEFRYRVYVSCIAFLYSLQCVLVSNDRYLIIIYFVTQYPLKGHRTQE